MEIRKFKPEDQEEKKKVHKKSIREVASEDYSEEQVHAWSDFTDYGEVEDKAERWVVEQDGKLIGFADYIPEKSRVTGVYVHPDNLRQGVGSKLIQKIFKDARNRELDELTCESSVTARKFYEDHGFELVEKTVHETNGVEMDAFEMKKEL